MSAIASNEAGLQRPTPKHLWVVGVLALLWNLVGVFDYLATQLEFESYMSQFTQEQLDYFYGFPAWATSAWAFAVWGSLLGSIGLLMRRRWAVWAFGIALAGLVFSTIYSFVLSNGAEMMGSGGTVFTLVIFVIAIFLFVYARKQAAAGVLR